MSEYTLLDWTEAEVLGDGKLFIKVHMPVIERERRCAADEVLRLDDGAIEADVLGPTFVSIRSRHGTEVKVATRVHTMLGPARRLWRGQEHFLVATFPTSVPLVARWWARC